MDTYCASVHKCVYIYIYYTHSISLFSKSTKLIPELQKRQAAVALRRLPRQRRQRGEEAQPLLTGAVSSAVSYLPGDPVNVRLHKL